MGGVWNTYGAGVENGIAKNCKIAPRQDRSGKIARRTGLETCILCEKTDFFHIRFLPFTGYYKYRFFVN